ncbi:MAG: T9SS type A sorting domain-containing protein [Flavobacteriales bacterium]|nr:T9SS type A sorting domain-containing protein [Flavobacteriales bacterium]
MLTGAAVTPPCPGSTTVPCVQGGQYVLVNVVAGNTYTFSTCAATFDTEITLYNNAGGGSIGYNDDACGAVGFQSTVTWTATFTGQLRVLVDAFPCATNAICAPLVIACSPPPAGDCIYTLTMSDAFSDGWGTSFVTITINGVATNYTVPVGVPSVAVQIGVNIGDGVVITYNASGAFQTDNSYIVTLGGSTIFNSGSPPVGGVVYVGSVTCIPPPPGPEDCLGAVTICSNVAFSNNTTNTGSIVDIDATNSGCLDIIEFQGTWYVFSPSSAGNLGLTIAPLGPDDYDWAIWGPYPPGSTPNGICPPAGPPIRCAASSGPATFASTGSYATGMGDPVYSPPQFASTAVSYGLPATLNVCPLVPPQYCGWVPGMQVNVGEVYLMYISNWSQSSIGFELDWNLQNGASLDCTVLPVELLSLQAYAVTGGVNVDWSTATEFDNDRFEIERSLDGEHFEHIGTMPGAGNSLQTLYYTFLDPQPHHGNNYYRLRQVDHNGDHVYSPLRLVQFGSIAGEVQMVPNPGSSFVDVLWSEVEPGSVLVMHDATGREVWRVRLEGPRTTMDVSSLARGVYGSHVQLLSGEHSGTVVWVRE